MVVGGAIAEEELGGPPSVGKHGGQRILTDYIMFEQTHEVLVGVFGMGFGIGWGLRIFGIVMG